MVKKNDVEQYNVKCVNHDLKVGKDGLLQVDGIGTGFLRITKKAIDHAWDNSVKYVENGIEKRMAFNVSVENDELVGEDISFCKLLGPLGIYLDTRFTIPHMGAKLYTGKFDSWLSGIKAQIDKKEMVRLETANG